MWRWIGTVVAFGTLAASCTRTDDAASAYKIRAHASAPRATHGAALPPTAPKNTPQREEALALASCPRQYAYRYARTMLDSDGKPYRDQSTRRRAAELSWRGSSLSAPVMWHWDDHMSMVSYKPASWMLPEDELSLTMLHDGQCWYSQSGSSLWSSEDEFAKTDDYGLHVLFEAWGADPPNPWKVIDSEESVVRGQRARWWRFEQPKQVWDKWDRHGVIHSFHHETRRLDVLIAADGTLVAARHVFDVEVRVDQRMFHGEHRVRSLHLTSACGRPVFDEPPHARPPDGLARAVTAWLKEDQEVSAGAKRPLAEHRWHAFSKHDPRMPGDEITQGMQPASAWEVSISSGAVYCKLKARRTGTKHEVFDEVCR